MKISKKLEPLIIGLFASIIIGLLAFLSFETSTGFWLMFSFGSTTLIVLVFFESEFAQPANVFFGHLLAIVIGILFNEFIGMSYLSLGLAVGTTVTLMMYFKIIHPPAAANPLIALFADVSLGYIIFPVMVGSIVIIILSVIINKYILKRKNQLEKAKQDLYDNERIISLLWRNKKGERKKFTQINTSINKLQIYNPDNKISLDILKTIEQFPQMLIYDNKIDQINNKLIQANNYLAPKLDLELQTSNGGAQNLENNTENESKIILKLWNKIRHD